MLENKNALANYEMIIKEINKEESLEIVIPNILHEKIDFFEFLNFNDNKGECLNGRIDFNQDRQKL